MKATTRVDFHCHSTHSDGTLEPRELAQQLAAEGVAFAALTDHDTVDGLPAFHQALSHRGLGFIPGVELTVQYQGAEAHLLGYGLDPEHPELLATLASLRQIQAPGLHSIAGSLRQRGSAAPPGNGTDATSAGRIDMAAGIALIHRAGGKAFLAHPHMLGSDLDEFRTILRELQPVGLDGVEAYYHAYSPAQRQMLADLAAEFGLLTSGGSDAHERGGRGSREFGVEMPTEAWKAFRDGVCARGVCLTAGQAGAAATPPRVRMKRRHFLAHVVLPTVLALGLFAVAMFAVFLPAFQRSLLDRKREMIRELTASAWSILSEYQREEREGKLTRAQAQQMARERIEGLRYGKEGKDYFWLQDLRPRIIMHPYRRDLNGQDVSDFQDARGVRIFVAFADLARRDREGYLEYYWQWKDDPTRVVPKESYIKGFQPWGWIIGTGIYLDDVHEEIARLQRHLVQTFLIIAAVVCLLLFYVMQQSLRLERERSEAEEGLRDSTERYRSLVEATTEGTLLVLEGRCRYANPILRDIVDYAEAELGLLDLADLLPEIPENEAAWAAVRGLSEGADEAGGYDGLLRRQDGQLVACVLGLSRLTVGEEAGFILLARDVSPQAGAGDSREQERRRRLLQEVADEVPTGLLRARLTAPGTVLECNEAAAQMLRGPSGEGPLALAGLFPDAAAFQEFAAEIQASGAATRRLHVLSEAPSTRTLELQAVLGRDAQGAVMHLDCTLEDVTRDELRDREREAAVERLQTSLLFLHEPVGPLSGGTVFCGLETTVQAAAAMMAAAHASAVLVQAETGAVVGILTDHDLRTRVVATGGDPHAPIYRVMSSPLVTIHEKAEIYEALLLMEEKNVQHLAVVDDSGKVLGVIRIQELLQFHSYGAIVLTREIQRATTADEVVRSCRRMPSLAQSLLDCGALPERLTRMITSVCDAATERFIALAQAELGPSPVPFAFLALGSQGRQEQTLFSDQDNALLYASADGLEDATAAEYLLQLGQKVCAWLDQAGYPFCHGEVMAQNPRWVQPLAVWQRYFSDWMKRAEPQQLLEFSIFFDFRLVHGEAELVQDLRAHVHRALQDSPAFLPHLAQNSLLFKPPVRLFGRVMGAGEHSGQLNMKDAMMPLVSFARLYGLRQGLAQTNTLDRLAALAAQGIIVERSHEETLAAYEILMRLRLRRQAEALHAGQQPDNVVSYRRLRAHEGTLLNQAFAQIAAIQKRIGQDFLGGGG